MTSSDRIYITMPMYHSAAGILGLGQVVLSGCSAVVRKKFSATRFWEECREFDCTASQYIGEICRYLLVQPPRASDTEHKVRLMYGNGLRPQIWKEFVARFGVAQIGEFYGSTEGNTSLINIDSTVGACGFLPVYKFLHPFYPVSLVKVDEATGELVRDRQGFCVRCQMGESGEIVGKIVKGDPVKDFVGYVSGKDTDKKILRNVFSEGDVAFSSGDILYVDEMGNLFFKDRTGDTFRWKGENVSTTEVEAVVQKAAALGDATVYGVHVPGAEGRAGMAAVVDENDNIDLVNLNRKLKETLPAYARPVFLRLCKQVDTTGTYKLKKTEMQKAGFDPALVKGDRLFFLSPKSGEYEAIDSEVHRMIVEGRIKL